MITQNLYIWQGDDVLRNYGNGTCFALADTLPTAVAELRKQLIEHYSYMIFPDDPDSAQWLEDKLAFLQRQPDHIHSTTPGLCVAYCIQGSE